MRISAVLLALFLAPAVWADDAIVPVKTLSGHPGGVYSLSFMADSQVLVSAGEGGTINLWDMKDFHPMRTWKDHSDSVNSAFYSPDGKYLISGSDDQTVILRSATDYAPAERIQLDAKITALAQSPDGKSFAAALLGGKVKMLNGRTYEAVKTLNGNLAVFSDDDRFLAVSGDDGKIRLLDRNGLAVRSVLTGHKGGVTALAFSKNGARLASGGADHTVKIWDVAAARRVKTIPSKDCEVKALAFSPSRRFLAFGGNGDPDVSVWDFTRGRKVKLSGHRGAVLSAAFSPDGRWLVSGGADKTVKVWDAGSFAKMRKK